MSDSQERTFTQAEDGKWYAESILAEIDDLI